MFRVLIFISLLLLTSSSHYIKINRVNFLLIVSEDNGPELGCYGTPIRTPNIDQLASDGFLFEKGSIESMEAFLYKLSNLSNYGNFSKNSRLHVEKNFSSSYIASCYIKLIQSNEL